MPQRQSRSHPPPPPGNLRSPRRGCVGSRNIPHCRASLMSSSPWSPRSRPSSPRKTSALTSRRCCVSRISIRTCAPGREPSLPRSKPKRKSCPRASRSPSCPRTPPTRAVRSSRSGRARAGTKRLCSPAICSACTSNTPSGSAGRLTSCRRARGRPGGSRRLSRRFRAAACSPDSSSRAAFIACNACRRPRPRGASTRRRRPSPCCRSPRKRTLSSTRPISKSTPIAPRRRRPACQQDRIRDPHHPPADRRGGRDAGGAVPASQPRQGDGPLALAHPGRKKPETGRRPR